MRRRDFIALLSGAAVAQPMSAYAKVPTIGYLGNIPSVESAWFDGLVRRLGELGWIDGQTIAIERRWAEGRPDRVAEIAADYVKQQIDVIVTYGGAVTTLKNATATIPIVFAIATDPLSIGIVTSLSHPGGNVTGLSDQQTDIASKRLELLRQILPHLSRLAIVFDASYVASEREMDNVQNLARGLGLEVMPHGVKPAEELDKVFAALRGQADAAYIVENSIVNVARVAALVLRQLPMMASEVDDEIEFRRLLDRNVRWFSSSEYLIDDLSRTPEQVRKVCSIRH
jgi:putative ABC transport system substrate-binding protein